ncbi:hypothetical protein Tco_0001375 [Tanacetum coccineum]
MSIRELQEQVDALAQAGTHPSLIRVDVTIKTLVLTNLHSILRVSHSSLIVMSYVEVRIIVLIAKQGTCPFVDQGPCYNQNFSDDQPPFYFSENNHILKEILRTQMPNSPVVLKEPEGSNNYTEEPLDTILIGDKVISTILKREYDKLIKSSVDDLVPILRDSKMKSVCDDLECDMSATSPLPTTNVREEIFYINSPQGEQVVNFLMENVDVADLPRHMVKQLFGLLVKNLSSTKRMSDEPLGDDTKPRSYDVTFSNPLFTFNDDFTLCKDNPLFDEEFEDISSLDPPKLTPVIDEPTLLVTLPLSCTNVLGDAIVDIDLLLGEQLDTLSTRDREIDFIPIRDIEELERLLANDPVPVPRVFDVPLSNSDSMSRPIVTSDLILEELITEISLDDSISTDIDDRNYDSEGDILYFEKLLNEDSSSDVSPALLPTESSLLVTLLPDPEQICLREVERFDPFFSLTQSRGTTRVMETPYFGFHHMPSPRPVAYSLKEVMYFYYHPHLTTCDGSYPETKSKIPYDLEDLCACFQSSNHAVSGHLHVYILGILNPDHIYI